MRCLLLPDRSRAKQMCVTSEVKKKREERERVSVCVDI